MLRIERQLLGISWRELGARLERRRCLHLLRPATAHKLKQVAFSSLPNALIFHFIVNFGNFIVKFLLLFLTD